MQSIRLLPGTADSLNYQAAAGRRASLDRFGRRGDLTVSRRKVTLPLVRAECSLNYRAAAERHRSRPTNR
jgi:hypothetical protein